MFAGFPDIMSVIDVAKALGIGKNAAYTLIRDGSIGAKYVGRKILVPKICVIDYVLSARKNMDAYNGRQSCPSEESLQIKSQPQTRKNSNKEQR